MSISKNRMRQKQIQLAIMVANAGLNFESEPWRKKCYTIRISRRDQIYGNNI